MKTEHMTGAELQTLREACHLSRDELATLAGVQARTVKHWENGRAGVPGDVAELARSIDAIISRAAREALAHIGGASPENGELVFTRYRSDADLHRYRPDMRHMPASAQAAMVARVRSGLVLGVVAGIDEASAQALRVVWFEPEQFEAWRAVHNLANNEAARAAWAAQALTTQALAHRTDQPPPGV